MASNSNPLLNHPRYEKVKTLGQGAFGIVLLCKDKQEDRHVAIKLLNRGTQVNEYVQTELLNHRRLHHPHVIKMREVFLTTHHLCIVLEYADQGDMFSYVTKQRHLDERMGRWMFQQLIVGLDYMHRMGICSRDVKLENTLVKGNPANPVLKICDFGYSKSSVEQSQAQTTVGTCAYMAPEVATEGCKYDGQIADIWSCGVMLYIMLVGRYPFERPGDDRLGVMGKQTMVIQRILRRDVEFPATLSSGCRDLLDKLLTLDPQKRITIPEIQAHPWYLKYLPNGVLGMNDRLIAHRVPEGIMLIHKEQLIALWKEAQRRLPYNAPPLPYNPIVTPIAPDTPAPQTPPVAAPQPPPPAAAAHMAHQESGSGVHYSVQPLTAGTAGTATPAVAPTALLPPAAVQTVPDPQSRVVQATLMPSPHNQQQQQQPVFVQPVAAAPAVQPVVRTTKQAGQYVAPAYVPYPSQRVPARPAARPAPAKQEGMLTSGSRHTLSKCKDALVAVRNKCKRLFAGK